MADEKPKGTQGAQAPDDESTEPEDQTDRPADAPRPKQPGEPRWFPL